MLKQRGRVGWAQLPALGHSFPAFFFSPRWCVKYVKRKTPGFIEPLRRGLEHGNNDVTVAKRPSVINLSLCTATSTTPLHLLRFVQILLNAGANVNHDIEKDDDNNSCTALSFAIKFGHVKVIRELLKHGAKANATRKGGYTALHRAVDGTQRGTVQALIDGGVDINYVHWHRGTALSIARRDESDELIKLLLREGADCNVQEPDNGADGLHISAVEGRDDFTQILLEVAGDVHLVDTLVCYTPLLVAAAGEHLPVMRRLVKAGSYVNFIEPTGRNAVSLTVGR